MRRARDRQRSRMYKWENAVVRQLLGRSIADPEFSTVEQCAAYAAPIWRRERARVGLARVQAPRIERPSWGQRSALAHPDHRVTLPRWARSRWVILHELAHRLTPRDEAHGPRFVGVLIGLAARWLDLDADRMMRMADEYDVRYYVRSIGVVPVWGPTVRVERALRQHGPMTLMDLCCHLSIFEEAELAPAQVRGAALHLVGQGRARWFRGRLQLLDTETEQAVAPVRTRRERRTPTTPWLLARTNEIEIERLTGGGWMVYPNFCGDDDDPHAGDHFVEDLSGLWERVKEYVALRSKLQGPAAAAWPWQLAANDPFTSEDEAERSARAA